MSTSTKPCAFQPSGALTEGNRLIIGDRPFPALVNDNQINAHLRILGAFRNLKNQAENPEAQGSDQLPVYQESSLPSYAETVDKESAPAPANQSEDSDPYKLWSIFLTKALRRFEIYIQKILTSESTGARPDQQAVDLDVPPLFTREEADQYRTDPVMLRPHLLPPLDVLMIWHSYLLNPSRYYEDLKYNTTRANLAGVQFPLEDVVSRIDPVDLQYHAPEAAQHWEMSTGEPFDSFRSGNTACPVSCHNCNEVKFMPWDEMVTDSWSFKCEKCSFVTTKSRLLGRRWLVAAKQWTQGSSNTKSYRLPGAGISSVTGCYFLSDPYSPFLSRLFDSRRKGTGLMLNLRGDVRSSTDVDIHGKIRKAHITPEEIYESAYHDVEQIGQLVHSKVKDLTNDKFANLNHLSQENLYRRVSLMMSFYLEQNVISTASLDLVAAVQRQFRFIENIENLGWLHPKKPSDHQVTIVRYHAWLNIVSKHTKMLCPTLDIDLAWHTHQLNHAYYIDCFWTVLRFLDHNDKVEKTFLRGAFDDTGSLWKREYNQPYSVCACKEHSSPFKIAKEKLKELKGKNKQTSEDVKVTEPHSTNPSTHNATIRPESKEKHKDIFE